VDNIINSGGIKLVPEQIEEKLLPLISNPFFITKKKDTILGEKVVLVIEGTEDKDLIDLIKNTNLLSKYEKPKEILFLKKFVRTETNKINRNASLRLA
jgi:O-succinylbenzoic acid--CoA ligase